MFRPAHAIELSEVDALAVGPGLAHGVAAEDPDNCPDDNVTHPDLDTAHEQEARGHGVAQEDQPGSEARCQQYQADDYQDNK